jgi:hypothetical protein
MKIYKILSSAAFVAVLSFTSLQASALDSVNGSNCKAANLNQAFELAWNQARVINPSSNTVNRFVVCNISIGVQAIEDGRAGADALLFTAVEAGAVTGWFDTGVTDSISCIVREISASQSGNAGVDQVTLTIAPADTLPGTRSVPWVADDGIDVALLSGSSLTATCQLPPGTGIQYLNTVHTGPTLEE